MLRALSHTLRHLARLVCAYNLGVITAHAICRHHHNR